jgi:mono/diheme cytochrome c family protein
VLVLALNGYEIGLLFSAGLFICFALVVAIVVPRVRPDFPGRYLGWFLAAAILFFVGQMTAVLLLANLGEKEAEAAPTATQPTTTLPTVPTTTTAPTTTAPTTTAPTATTPTTTAPTTTTGTTTTTAPPAGGQGDPVEGKKIFLAQPCGGCHTLADAGTSGTVGPNLDDLKPPYDKVVTQVTNGGAVMPSFKDTLTPQQIQDVAAYVSSVAGK